MKRGKRRSRPSQRGAESADGTFDPDAGLARTHDGLGAILRVQLVKNARNVIADSLLRQYRRETRQWAELVRAGGIEVE